MRQWWAKTGRRSGAITQTPTPTPTPTPPTVSGYAVENANPNDWVLTFSEAVTTTAAGFTLKIDGVSATISGTSGTGTNTITFTTTETPAFGDVLTLDYSSSSGNCISVSSSTEVEDITGASVTNNVLAAGSTTWTMDTITGAAYDFNMAKPSQFDAAAAGSLPVLIFLHGTGQTSLSDGLTRDANTPISLANSNSLTRTLDGNTWPCIIAAPFDPTYTLQNAQMRDIYDILVANAATYKIDTSKIFVTGLSLGAIGIHHQLALSTADSRARTYQGFFPMSGCNVSFGTTEATNAATRGKTIRGWYGEDDANPWVTGGATSMSNAQAAINGQSAGLYELTEIPSPAAHNPAAWGVPYSDMSETSIYKDVIS